MISFRVLWKSVRDFSRDDGITLAGSMSYFTMMAFVPFCLFMITLFGQVLGRYPDFFRFFLNRLASLFPEATSGITQEIMKLISFRGLGKLSLILYGFLSYQFFESIERSLNVIFKVKKRRNFFLSVLISMVLVTFIIIIVMASFVAASAMPLLYEIRAYLPYIRISRVTEFVIRFVLPFIMVFFTVTLVYKLLPMARVKISNAARGAIFTTVFLEAAKYAFTWYVITIGQFGRIYGSLTAFIVFLLWMFYSSCIFLIGAEIVHNLDKTGKGVR